MNSTVLKEVIAFLFGRKYYANIIATKGTGEIINIADCAKVTLDKCDSWGNPIELGFDETEILQEPTNDIDWEQRRYEIAKEMLPITYQESRNILLRGGDVDTPDIIESAVKFADMLITELKKEGAR